ncbi:MAG TPA: O-antigen ligase family protein [Gemmatimonadaceae bacterium]|nr:O-antigen ligase family protein [Gemmatimonadaceae bacterium]
MLWLSAVLVTLAWGVGAFGSPYPWAYSPLVIASAALGVAGLWLGRTKSSSPLLIQLGFVLIALAVGAQMVPIPLSRLAALSPHAGTILRQQSLQFSMGQSPYHSLSIDSSRSQLGLAFFGAFALLLLGTARVLRRETANRLAGALVILGVIVATVGIVQRATFNGKIYGFWENVQHGLVFGPFVNRNHFAGWMLMVIPVGFGYFLAAASRGMDGRKPGLRNLLLWFSSEAASRAMLTGFAILVMALSLVLTMSRSGMLALLAAMLVAGTMTARRQSGISHRAVTVGYLIFLLVAVVSWVGIDQIASRFAEADLTSINERPAIWADTARIVKDFWLTGTGLNTYGVSTLFYQTSMPGQHLREAHSDYLQLAAEGGLLLGIPIAITIVAFVRALRQRVREDVGSIWWIRMGAITGLIAIALQSIVEFSLQMPGNAAMFAVIAGLAIHDGRRV